MSDAHPQGGNLFDMAKEGTRVPADAAKLNVDASGTQASSNQHGAQRSGLGSTIADNTLGSTGLGEVVSAGGDIPEDVGQKYSRGGGKERGEKQSTPHGGRNQPSHG
ncbi:hypothetical protein B0H66DRAFT_601284 [Apodospora peruviana]|uniref:Uncharacterized protein n=1 Tax=Apodospora peruviana TaxID=516989 RepID=A0AAE0IB74_9PEZI|nr:hypothetical protein B0H66DRAFT_601284 [Apodospora peruviana]